MDVWQLQRPFSAVGLSVVGVFRSLPCHVLEPAVGGIVGSHGHIYQAPEMPDTIDEALGVATLQFGSMTLSAVWLIACRAIQ